MKSDRDRCLESGMNGYVTKPIRPDELWQVLLDLVQQRPGLGATDATPAPLMAQAEARDTPEHQELLEELGRVAGLDITAGLRGTMGNVALYASMLRKFLTGQADTIERISRSLEAGDEASAERYAHTLKGVSASLGANRLAHIADALERCLRTGARPEARNAALAHTQELLESLLVELVALPHLQAAEAPAVPLTDAEQASARATLQTVAELMAEDDSRAADLWEAHAAALKTLVHNPEALDAAIRGFDFETALSLLGRTAEGASAGNRSMAAASGAAPLA
jgi:HPt (histidine-containing phosphotransfer) domain-containing protein